MVKLSDTAWQYMQRTLKVIDSCFITPTNSDFEMSFGKTWRLVKPSGIGFVLGRGAELSGC
ncbi:MAG: hypothetical protein JO065_09040 [Acidobacteria bacterium]|nr:hypothetical protein [Acidobacteriota bacterium]